VKAKREIEKGKEKVKRGEELSKEEEVKILNELFLLPEKQKE